MSEFDIVKFENEYKELILEGIKNGDVAFRFEHIRLVQDGGQLRVEEADTVVNVNEDGSAEIVESNDVYYQLSAPINAAPRGRVILYQNMRWNNNGGSSYTVETPESSNEITLVNIDDAENIYGNQPLLNTASIECPWGFEVNVEYTDTSMDTFQTSIDCFGTPSDNDAKATVVGLDGAYNRSTPYSFQEYDTSRYMYVDGVLQTVELNETYTTDASRHKKFNSIQVQNNFPVGVNTFRELTDVNDIVARMFCIDNEPFADGFKLSTTKDAFLPSLFINPAAQTGPAGYIDGSVNGVQNVFDIYGDNTLDLDISHQVIRASEEMTSFYTRYLPDIQLLDPSTMSPAATEFLRQSSLNAESAESNTALIVVGIALGLVLLVGTWAVVKKFTEEKEA